MIDAGKCGYVHTIEVASKMWICTYDSCLFKHEIQSCNTPICGRINKLWFSLKNKAMTRQSKSVTANLKIIDVRYQLSTVFSTSLLLENR